MYYIIASLFISNKDMDVILYHIIISQACSVTYIRVYGCDSSFLSVTNTSMGVILYHIIIISQCNKDMGVILYHIIFLKF